MPFLAAVVTTITASLLCLLVISVYKQWQLSVLEGCFLVNIVMLNCGALYIETQGVSKDILTCISLGVTFILFLIITAYHVWRKLKRFVNRRGYEHIGGNIQASHEDEPLTPRHEVTYQEVSLREPLLDDST